jgi:RNA polymerase sigma factor (sigma-70 family)
MVAVLAEVSDDGMPRDPVARGGPLPYFEAVYATELGAVTRIAYLVVRSRSVAEELAQEAFLRLYDHFDEVENPAGFLRTVVVRLGTTWRNRHRMEQERLTLVAGNRPVDPGAGAFDIDETWEALGRLDPDRAAVLVLRFYEDLSHAEIGAIVGASAATVRSRTRRALQDLRKELER